ncbi:hypothetical protein, partial [Bacteroides heparinolyticus]|uniref:hypothetical protein n=1 Tax=Prevotella heparinolytica TaxID=28113 RepID=UPI00359F9C30
TVLMSYAKGREGVNKNLINRDLCSNRNPFLLRATRGYDLPTELLPKIALFCLLLSMQKNDKTMQYSKLSFLLFPELSLDFYLPTLRGR